MASHRRLDANLVALPRHQRDLEERRHTEALAHAALRLLHVPAHVAVHHVHVHVTGEEAAFVAREGEKLRGLIAELEEWGRRAQALIQSSLEVVNASIALFSGAAAGGKTYGVDGTEKNLGHGRTSLVFDAKA